MPAGITPSAQLSMVMHSFLELLGFQGVLLLELLGFQGVQLLELLGFLPDLGCHYLGL